MFSRALPCITPVISLIVLDAGLCHSRPYERYGVDSHQARFEPNPRPTSVKFRSGSNVAGLVRIFDPEAAGGVAEIATAESGVSDGVGGAYIVWERWRGEGPTNFISLYVQRLTPQGTVAPGWPRYGVGVAAVPGSQVLRATTTDGEGGIIVVFSDYARSTNVANYLQRIDSTGALLWGDGGVRLSTTGFASTHAVVCDGSGGAIAAWTRWDEAGDTDIVAQRITGDGMIAAGWPADGVVVCDASGDQLDPAAVPDDSAGAIIGWYDRRSGGVEEAYFQRVDASGTLRWNDDGIRVIDSFAINHFETVPDGAGGAIVVWAGPGSSSKDVFGQRLGPGGEELWGPGGKLLCGEAADQGVPYLSRDVAGGAYLAWRDQRGGIYGLRITPAGDPAPGWPADGLRIGNGGSEPRVLADEAGVFVSWHDPVLTVQRVTSNGQSAPGWPSEGRVVSTSSSYSSHLTPDGAAGVFLDWSGPGWLYGKSRRVQHVSSTSTLLWPSPGLEMNSEEDCQFDPTAAHQSPGNTFVFWEQRRTGSGDIMGRRIGVDGNPIGPTLVVSDEVGDQLFPVARPWAGGAIVAWLDWGRGGSFAQRFEANGVALWPSGGVPVRSTTFVSTQGGIVFIFPGDDGTLRAQSIDPAVGAPQWGPAGVVVGDSPDWFPWVQAVEDSLGGVIIAWRVDTYPTISLRAQRLDASGARLWEPAGVEVVPPIGWVDHYYSLVPDLGGAYIFWLGEYEGIRAQRLDSAGGIASGWPTEGLILCDSCAFPLATVSGNGSIVAWTDSRGPDAAVYAQRIMSSGAVAWTPGGIPISLGPGNRFLESILHDSVNGAIVVWNDGRGSSWDLYAQRVDASGAPLWDPSGVAVSTAPELQSHPVLISDGAHGAVVVWQDSRDLPVDLIFAQHIASEGTPGWAIDGTTSTLASLVRAEAFGDRVHLLWEVHTPSIPAALYRTEPGADWKELAHLMPDGTGRVAYEDRHVLPGRRYGYRLGVVENGALQFLGETWVTIPSSLSLSIGAISRRPGDATHAVEFTLPESAPAALEVIDVSGRLVHQHRLALPAGTHVVHLAADHRMHSGVYFVRLKQRARVASRRFVLIE